MLGERERDTGEGRIERGAVERGRKKNEGREEERGRMRGDRKGKEEEEDMRGRQLEGKATVFGCGSVRERNEHREEKRQE